MGSSGRADSTGASNRSAGWFLVGMVDRGAIRTCRADGIAISVSHLYPGPPTGPGSSPPTPAAQIVGACPCQGSSFLARLHPSEHGLVRAPEEEGGGSRTRTGHDLHFWDDATSGGGQVLLLSDKGPMGTTQLASSIHFGHDARVPTDRKPRLSFQVEPEDQEALDRLMKLLPGSSSSAVLRAAVRLGLAEIALDPGLIATADTPTIPASLPARSSSRRRND